MCLDISFKIDDLEDSLFDYLPGLKIDPQVDIDFENISHMQAHDRPKTTIIYTNADGHPYLTLMRWGILMKYMFKDPDTFKRYANNNYNTRAENVFDTKSTWYRIRTKRCLIDTPGIYEHRAIDGWKNKVPYFIQLTGRKRMLIPGFYHFPDLAQADIERILASGDKEMITALNKIVNLETGEIVPTYSMITREANQKMRYIHNHGANKNRMPLFMEPARAVKWLDPGLSDEEMKTMLEYEIPSESLIECPVWTIRTTNTRPDNKMKHVVFNWPNLPALGDDKPRVNELF